MAGSKPCSQVSIWYCGCGIKKLWKTFTSQKWIISIYKRSFLILSFNMMKSSQSLFLLCHFYVLCSQQKNLSKNDIDRPGFLPFCCCYENYKNILQIIFHFGELVNIVHNAMAQNLRLFATFSEQNHRVFALSSRSSINFCNRRN